MSEAPQSLAGNSALILAARVLGNAGLLASVLVLARALGPSGRGAIAFLITTSMVTAYVASLGAGPATLIFSARSSERRPQLLANLVLSAGLGSLLLSCVVVAGLLAIEGMRPASLGNLDLVLLAAAAVLTALNDGAYFFLQGSGRLRQWALSAICVPWIYAAVLLAVWATSGLSVTGAAAIYVGQVALRSAWTLTVSARAVGLARPSLALWRETRGFGLRAWLGTLSAFLAFRADVIVMGLITTEAALGIYAVAVNVAEIALLIPLAVATALPALIAGGEPGAGAERALRPAGARDRHERDRGGRGRRVPLPAAARLRAGVPGLRGTAAVAAARHARAGRQRGGLQRPAGVLLARPGLAGAVRRAGGRARAGLPAHSHLRRHGAAIASSVAYCTGAVASLYLYARVAGFGLAELVPRARDARGLVLTAARGCSRAVAGRPVVATRR